MRTKKEQFLAWFFSDRNNMEKEVECSFWDGSSYYTATRRLQVKGGVEMVAIIIERVSDLFLEHDYSIIKES